MVLFLPLALQFFQISLEALQLCFPLGQELCVTEPLAQRLLPGTGLLQLGLQGFEVAGRIEQLRKTAERGLELSNLLLQLFRATDVLLPKVGRQLDFPKEKAQGMSGFGYGL